MTNQYEVNRLRSMAADLAGAGKHKEAYVVLQEAFRHQDSLSGKAMNRPLRSFGELWAAFIVW